MAQAHYHLTDGRVVMDKPDVGLAAISHQIRQAYSDGELIVVNGFDDGQIDSILVNPDQIVKVILISD